VRLRKLSAQHEFFNVWNRKERYAYIGLMNVGGVCIVLFGLSIHIFQGCFQWCTKVGGGGVITPPHSEVLTKLSQIPSSMENISATT
jgi:hypothetical protein